MDRHRMPPISLLMSGAVGASLVAIGLLLTVDPRAGERAFGKAPGGGNDYTFHRASGVRQAYLGTLIVLLAIAGERRALSLLLITASVVPAADFMLALGAPGGSFARAFRHVPSVPLVLGLGVHFLRSEHATRNAPPADQP